MTVALYARVSSDKQDIDLSISAQIRALRDFAIRSGHEIVREFIDEAESGRSAARPAFKEMIILEGGLDKVMPGHLVYDALVDAKYSDLEAKCDALIEKMYWCAHKHLDFQIKKVEECNSFLTVAGYVEFDLHELKSDLDEVWQAVNQGLSVLSS